MKRICISTSPFKKSNFSQTIYSYVYGSCDIPNSIKLLCASLEPTKNTLTLFFCMFFIYYIFETSDYPKEHEQLKQLPEITLNNLISAYIAG